MISPLPEQMPTGVIFIFGKLPVMARFSSESAGPVSFRGPESGRRSGRYDGRVPADQ